MIVVMKADVTPEHEDLKRVVALAAVFPGVTTQVHQIQGATRSLTEIYLLGSTGVIPI